PGNIMLTKVGTKLLDFGLAKLQAPEANAAVSLSVLPTEAGPLTAKGTILGTFQYMAPEQLEGKDADARTDIFAFGAVVYEMATGRKAFEGRSPASLIAAILGSHPPAVSSIQPMSPPALDRMVKTCLAKEPDERWQSARDLKRELQRIAGGGPESPVPAVAMSQGWSRWAWKGATAVLLAVTLAFAVAYFHRPLPETRAVKLTLLPPEKTSFNEIAVSPDGRRLAFTATDAFGKTQLWVRPLDSLSAQPLPGTEGASYPFWSPDSRFLGFFAAGKLKKIEASGGPPQTLCNAPVPRGGAWGSDGVIVFAPSFTPLFRVSAAGGEPQPVTSLDASRSEVAHRWPQFLPDGKHFLFLAFGSPENTGIYLASLDSKDRTRLLGENSSAAYASGYLLFLRERTLLAQPFDAARLQMIGEAVPVDEPVQIDSLLRARFSVSRSGVLVYDSIVGGSRRLLWFDRAGKQLSSVGDPGDYLNLNLSPDDQRVAANRRDSQTGTVDIWLFELSRGVTSRFTFGPGIAGGPVWSPDGSRIAFSSTRDGPWNLYEKLSNGGSDEPLLKSSNNKFAMGWSPDGRFLLYALYAEQDPKTNSDLWILPLEGGGKPFPFLRSAFNESQGQFSPDGRWIAYTSNESGKSEIYVRPFSGAEAGAGAKAQISSNGGTGPRWRRDGKELFYVAPDNKLMAVVVKAGAGAFQAGGVPQPLFKTRAADFNFLYAVAADGRRFLVISQAEQAASAPATVVLNWNAGLRR
ncbi:MAG: serine/threonine-protein kinase, partial [Acidobacteria bacterium]|nr:serine/threonine-protein kinase [Acidobacteriota bacterium]